MFERKKVYHCVKALGDGLLLIEERFVKYLADGNSNVSNLGVNEKNSLDETSNEENDKETYRDEKPTFLGQ